MRFATFLALVVTSAPLWADPAATARDAIAQLDAASARLASTDSGRGQVAALTDTVRGFEAGLSALRDGLRQVTIREAALARDLEGRRDDIARLLGVLQTIERAPAPLLLLHPSGPTGTARSAMILADVTPALQAEADVLARDLEELTILRALQQTALETLQSGLSNAQKARTELSLAISNRTDLPLRYTDDPEAMALLIASSETLEGFASGLAELPSGETPAVALSPGGLAPPVRGVVLRHAGEADAAGIVRPGTLIATAPAAVVTAPLTATLRYAGPLLDYGQVAVLEPEPDTLLILAGLGQVFGTPGEVLGAGAPIGLMGGTAGPVDGNLTSGDRDALNTRSETLYMELRNDAGPIDPATWFALDED